jgi:response regulator RpfG family c-di-GMP phosphodiesterase
MPDERRSGAERRTSITVVLVDDEPLIRTALAHTLSVSGLEHRPLASVCARLG